MKQELEMKTTEEYPFMRRGKGLLVVVSGPAGCGKGTVLNKVLAKDPNLLYSVSATTRGPRPSEIEGKNYYFLTREKFEFLIRTGDMLEYTEYCHNYYGTPRTVVEERLASGHDVILEIDVKGAMQVKKAFPGAVMIFIMPPSCTELEQRLRNRGTESDEVARERLVTADAEMSRALEYDYIVINAIVEKAANDISSILSAERLKTQRIK